MELAPPFLKEAGVGYLLGQRVLERVFQLGKEGRLVDELGRLEPREAVADGVLRYAGDRAEEDERDVLPDDGCRLEQRLVLRSEPVDPGSQDRLYGGRNLDGVERSGQPIGAACAGERARLGEGAHALLQEEGNALRPLDQGPLERVEISILTEESPK
jgi:hypothetical protein